MERPSMGTTVPQERYCMGMSLQTPVRKEGVIIVGKLLENLLIERLLT